MKLGENTPRGFYLKWRYARLLVLTSWAQLTSFSGWLFSGVPLARSLDTAFDMWWPSILRKEFESGRHDMGAICMISYYLYAQ